MSLSKPQLINMNDDSYNNFTTTLFVFDDDSPILKYDVHSLPKDVRVILAIIAVNFATRLCILYKLYLTTTLLQQQQNFLLARLQSSGVRKTVILKDIPAQGEILKKAWKTHARLAEEQDALIALYDRDDLFEVDLHGLELNGAVALADRKLRLLRNHHRLDPSLVATVVTGRGNHSRGGQPRIKPAVAGLLWRQPGCVFHWIWVNPGMIAVQVLFDFADPSHFPVYAWICSSLSIAYYFY